MDMGTVKSIADVLAVVIDVFATVLGWAASAIEWIVKAVGGVDFGGIFDSIGGFFGGLFG